MLLVILDIFFAFLIANYAEYKGQSFPLWCLISLVFSPVIGLLGLVAVLFFQGKLGNNKNNVQLL